MRSRRKRKTQFSKADCTRCSNCIPMGEGDHICAECEELVIVIAGYVPTEDFLKCGGSRFET